MTEGGCKGMSLWLEAEKNNNKKTSPSAHIGIRPKHAYKITKEAFLYTRQKASMTVEASIVIPLLVGFVVSLLFWFRLIQVQAAVEEALLYAARKTAIESSVVSEEELLPKAALLLLNILPPPK